MAYILVYSELALKKIAKASGIRYLNLNKCVKQVRLNVKLNASRKLNPEQDQIAQLKISRWNHKKVHVGESALGCIFNEGFV